MKCGAVRDFSDFGLQQVYALVLEIIFQLGRFEQLRGIARFEEHPVEIGGIFRRIERAVVASQRAEKYIAAATIAEGGVRIRIPITQRKVMPN